MSHTSTKILLTSLNLLIGCGGRLEEEGYDLGTRDGASSGGANKATQETAVGGSTMQTSHVGGASSIALIPSGGVSAASTYNPIIGGNTAITVATPACSPATDFIALALSSAEGNWVGGNPLLDYDDPCAVQGVIYAYSDQGLDGVPGTEDDTLSSPARDWTSADASDRLSPCAGGKCCINGNTRRWPQDASGAVDYTAQVWGAGIGLALSDYHAAIGNKQTYRGPIRGFVVALSGSLGGQALRIAYPQLPNDDSAPFREYSALGKFAVPFTGVTCPTWASTCIEPSQTPTDLQIQIVGGDVSNHYQVCIDSITPLL